MDAPDMPERRAFLSVRWERLCLVTYDVDPARLMPLLHPKLELDTRDGRAFVSTYKPLNQRARPLALALQNPR